MAKFMRNTEYPANKFEYLIWDTQKDLYYFQVDAHGGFHVRRNATRYASKEACLSVMNDLEKAGHKDLALETVNVC